MKIGALIQEFYQANGIPNNGGVNDKTFVFKIFGLKLIMPNPKFRRDALHVHDIQHVLNNCDTSWKGEAFISGWEISTGMWKHFPLGLLGLWAMGYALWIRPKDVLKGYRKGLENYGVIDQDFSREEFMQMEKEELVKKITKNNPKPFGIIQIIQFSFWIVMSQAIFLAPLLILGSLIISVFY